MHALRGCGHAKRPPIGRSLERVKPFRNSRILFDATLIASAGTARAKLFLRQLRRGSIMFGVAILATMTVVGLYEAYVHLFSPERYYAGEIIGGSILLGVTPSIPFAVLLWTGLSRLGARPGLRTALALLIAAMPILISATYLFVWNHAASAPKQRASSAGSESENRPRRGVSHFHARSHR